MSARISIPADLKPLFGDLDAAVQALTQLDTVSWLACPRGATRFQPQFEKMAEVTRRRIDAFCKIHNVSRSSVVTTALHTYKGLAKV